MYNIMYIMYRANKCTVQIKSFNMSSVCPMEACIFVMIYKTIDGYLLIIYCINVILYVFLFFFTIYKLYENKRTLYYPKFLKKYEFKWRNLLHVNLIVRL